MTTAFLQSYDTLQCEIEGDEPYATDLIKEGLDFAQELRRIGEHAHAELIEQTALQSSQALSHRHAAYG